MKILTIKNKTEERLLRKKTKPFDFSAYSKKEIADLVRGMRRLMKEADGIGLAANQVGFDFSMFVAEVDGKFYAIFNPEIIKTSKSSDVLEEGCLSVPGDFDEVVRAEKVTLAGQDRNGKKIKIKAWGLLARVFQHEADHLNGGLFLDKIKKR